ncbi:hypothetical protein J3E07_001605 [Methanococcus voltae]|uniref:Uncharacterized protein n=1 Tax=Methanococcus voltae TaxID=2188 RepID=A0A8J7UTY4_METVO|nr:hypothetical protein [Methanococcus voltae]MBP2202164.1 hypothetical protein [Methanococcus voltae]
MAVKNVTNNVVKSNTVNKLLKIVFCSLGFAGLFWYIMQNSVSGSEIITGFAAVPLIFYILIELIDHFVDMNAIYGKAFKNSNSGVLVTVLIAAVIFISLTYLLTGSMTLAIGSATPAIVVAAIFALYVLAPATGSETYMLYMYLGATMATMAKYLIIIPSINGIPGLNI